MSKKKPKPKRKKVDKSTATDIAAQNAKEPSIAEMLAREATISQSDEVPENEINSTPNVAAVKKSNNKKANAKKINITNANVKKVIVNKDKSLFEKIGNSFLSIVMNEYNTCVNDVNAYDNKLGITLGLIITMLTAYLGIANSNKICPCHNIILYKSLFWIAIGTATIAIVTFIIGFTGYRLKTIPIEKFDGIDITKYKYSYIGMLSTSVTFYIKACLDGKDILDAKARCYIAGVVFSLVSLVCCIVTVAIKYI